MSAKRIVFAGEFWDGSSCRGLAEGLRQLGHEVVEIDVKAYFAAGRSLAGRALARLSTPARAARYRRAVVRAVEAMRADIMLTMKGSYLGPDVLARIAAAGARTVNFWPDLHFRHGGFQPGWVAHYDRFVTTKSFHRDWLATQLPPERTGYVPHGYSPGIHTADAVPADDAGFGWDICYAGNASPYKVEWISGLRDRVPEARMLLVGHRWAPLAGPNTDIAGELTGRDFAAAISRSRINVAVHYGPDPVTGWADLVSTRSFEIPASGGFMLHIDNDELRGFFTPGAECDVFGTPDELADKVRHWLARPDERMAMAKAGHDRAVPAYSYHARAAELMALL